MKRWRPRAEWKGGLASWYVTPSLRIAPAGVYLTWLKFDIGLGYW
jgi:hypothetical protein